MSYSKQNFRSGDTLYASQLNAMDDEIAVLEAEVESTKNMVGSPLTASTAAGMSDQTKIYVYTGSETGYTAGHWYYHNGTVWTDGGVYNSVAVNTDTSLTVSGQAADSKAVGDAIDDLDSDLSDVKSDLTQLEETLGYYKIPQWESGGLDYGNGNATVNSARIRTTDYISPFITSVSVADGYYVMLYIYSSSGTYVGIWNPDTSEIVKKFIPSTSVDITQIPSYESYKYKLILRKTTDATITVDEADNVSYTSRNIFDEINEEVETVSQSVTTLSEDLSEVIECLKISNIKFEQGGIDFTNGNNLSGETRIRTIGYIGSSVESVSVAEGYYVMVYAFSNDAYVGIWNPATSAFVKALVSSTSVDITQIPSYQAYDYRLVIRKTNNGSITINDAYNLLYQHNALEGIDSEFETVNQTIADISGSIDSIYDTIGDLFPEFEMGAIIKYDGINASQQNRIRTVGYIDSSIQNVSVANGYYVMVFTYTSSDAYVGVWNPSSGSFQKELTTSTSVDITQIPSYKIYKYRLVLRKTDDENMSISEAKNLIISPKNNIEKLEENVENLDSLIPGYKSTAYYSADDTQTLVSTYSGVISLYDALVTAYPNYVTKNTLTNSNFTNYEYVFSMGNRNASGSRTRDTESEKPLVLIMSGVHGDERCSVIGLYLFAKALCEDPTMSSLRGGLTIKMIPIVCPSGYNNNNRLNNNSVNINRNFDANWVQTSAGQDYSGAAPADQPETQLVQAWMDANTDAVLALDWHNSGIANEISYLSTNSSTGFAPDVKKGFFYGIDHIVGRWAVERGITGNSVIYGYTGSENSGGHSETYCKKVGIDACLVETSFYVGTYSKDSASTIGINAEAFCALMRGIMEKYIDNL